MSLASNQAISMLAVVSGCMGTIEEELKGHVIAEQALPTVLYIHQIADNAIKSYPATGDSRKNYKWMGSRVREWNAFVADVSPKWTTIVLSQMPMLAMEDLLNRLKNPLSISLVQPVHEGLIGLSNIVDKEGTSFDAYKEAENILYRFYNILEFNI